MGGRLAISAKAVDLDEAYALRNPEARPGRYVVVAVSDNGVGMAPKVAEQAFDPFFTTKPVGEGTGLGLSMVYGFARQSGGQARIHSAPGVGTSVSIYLVAGNGAADLPADAAGEMVPVPEGMGQSILLVEDDSAVRLLAREALDELGYRTAVAADAEAALAILSSSTEIDLMVSDVGLPGMNGRQLAEAARQHRPELPILFITGYAENAAIKAGFLGTNMAMIAKPFAIDELASKVAEMLESNVGKSGFNLTQASS